MGARLCSVEGCSKKHLARGYCGTHYRRWAKDGEPGTAELLREPGRVCSVDGCGEPHHSHGLCSMHVNRLRDSGDVGPADRLQAKASARRVTEHEMSVIADLSIKQAEAAQLVGLSVQTISRIRKEIDAGRFRRNEWLDDEIDFVAENADKMPISKIAAFLGRSTDQVSTEIKRLQRHDVVVKGRPKNLWPWKVGRRTLLAKTCPGCGDLLAGEWFTKNNHGSGRIHYQSTCRKCTSDKQQERQRERGGERAKEREKQLQNLSLEWAENHGKEWTHAEVDILADETKSVLQKAKELKRTYFATQNAIARNGVSTQPRPDWAQMRKSHWHLFWDLENEDVAA